jgi:glycosyltransferase involved in cell wall biosynthesis
VLSFVSVVAPEPTPAVSVILPTYNRADFLRRAFSSIHAQTFEDWELVVVDDGSTDGTAETVDALSAPIRSRTSYVYQPNGGAYAARNTGLDRARGQYIAFFDSDDEWLPHHLAECVRALACTPHAHWVYGASRLVDDTSGAELSASSFDVDGAPRPFRNLRCTTVDGLHLFEEPDLIYHILSGAGLFCGLQNSVIRRSVFDQLRFRADARNEAEDQVFVIRALAAGFRFGYFDNIHHVYHVHSANSSASARDIAPEKQARIYEDLIRGFEELPQLVKLTPRQFQALKHKLAHEYFWHLGCATYWRSGRRQDALRAYRHAIRLTPLRLTFWKSYLLAQLRTTD